MDVHCTITMDEVEGEGHRIVASDISARAVVPGADAETFAAAARGRRRGCSFSALIRASATVTVEAVLEEGSSDGRHRTAHVTWSGSLMEGSGTITSVESGAFGPLDVTWAARTEDSDGLTSPEELIAAAHAACFSMALSHGLAQAARRPRSSSVDATVTFVPGTGITKIALDRSRDRARDRRGRRSCRPPQDAKENCPVSKALAAVPEITVEASLA